MSDLQAQLAAVATLPDQKQKLEQYKQLLNSTLASASVEGCNAFVDHMLSDEVPLVVSRQVLQVFSQGLSHLPAEAHKLVAIHALERIQPRVVSFEEQVASIREDLAVLLEKEEAWTQAAQTLAGIDLDLGMRVVEPQYKLAKNVKIAMLYLEDDDPVNAETFIKKASALLSGGGVGVSTGSAGSDGSSASGYDPVLELQYRTCYARIMDSKRRFLDAAQRYYELSSVSSRQAGGGRIDAEELSMALRAATTCTILAAAGPQRSRMLSALYKDERSAGLGSLYTILEKVYMDRILRPDEVEAFAQTLKPHQLATLPDGSTVLSRAVTEHNLLSASRLYNNIALDQLATLLGVSQETAEQVAASMVSEGRLHGVIDQVDGFITFDADAEPLAQWDAQVAGVCGKVNDIIDAMGALGIKPAPAAASVAS